MMWHVKLTIRKMGMQCQSCKQAFECNVNASTIEEAVEKAKQLSGANPEIHQFSIYYAKEIK